MAHMYTNGISESQFEIIKDDPKCRGAGFQIRLWGLKVLAENDAATVTFLQEGMAMAPLCVVVKQQSIFSHQSPRVREFIN